MAYKYQYNKETGKHDVISKDKRSYPLRKVVGRKIKQDEYNRWLNELECGHFVRPAKDFYGEIHSERQRCRYCYEISQLTPLTLPGE